MKISSFNERMNRDGYFLVEGFIDRKLIDRLLYDLKKSYLLCRKVQLRNGVENSEGTCHHLIGQGDSFMDCLASFEKINSYLEDYFCGKYILNSFGGNILKSNSSYANNIHRDQRSYSGDLPLMLNTIVMLDDFTKDNGATWLMKGGHVWENKPHKEVFYDNAIQAVVPAGSVLMFNSNLWHAAGENKSYKPRRSLTPIFSRPFVKPGYDYPRSLGYDYGSTYSSYLRQVLGYNSRVPADLTEWYQSKQRRYYRSDQE